MTNGVKEKKQKLLSFWENQLGASLFYFTSICRRVCFKENKILFCLRDFLRFKRCGKKGEKKKLIDARF
jgi:hypothetical protein